MSTTFRLWLERRARRVSDEDPPETVDTWRRIHTRRRIRVAILAVVVLAAAGVGVLLSGSSPKAGGQPGRASPVLIAQADRNQAASWISRQVAGAVIVSCDPVMCSALQAAGLPASREHRRAALGRAGPARLGPDRRDQRAEEPVRAAPDLGVRAGHPREVWHRERRGQRASGRAGRRRRLPEPVPRRHRRAEGRRRAVAARPRRDRSPGGQAAAVAGMVDARLLVAIATLAHMYQLHVVAFGDASPAPPGSRCGQPFSTTGLPDRRGWRRCALS